MTSTNDPKANGPSAHETDGRAGRWVQRRDLQFTRRGGDPPRDDARVTTIAWRLALLIVGFAETNGTHFGAEPTSPATFRYAGTAAEARHQLDETHATWVEGVRRLGQTGLASAQGPTQPPEFADAPMARLVLYTNLEVIHHGAEICLMRDLYRARESLGS